MVKIAELNTRTQPNWCPGCGNYSTLTALKTAVSELKLKPKDVCLTSGIGCGSKAPHWINTYGIHTIHGRGLPVATGIHLVNNKLKVISVGGDGDGYGIGLSHFIHSCRRNLDMTYLVQDNQIYGLTKGQTSPTTDKETKTVSTPFGAIEWPICPLSLALASGATFVARGFAGDIKHLTYLIKEAIMHSGFGFIDILQPCVIFNKKNTYQWFQERVYKLEDKKHNTSNFEKALEKAREWKNDNDKIPIGIFYRDEKKEHYLDRYNYIKKKSLIEQDISNIDISKIMEDFV